MTDSEIMPTQNVSDGALIGRSDLEAAVVIGALRDRLSECGKPATDAEATLHAAHRGDEEALSMLRTVLVPAPIAPLSMPVQRLSRGRRKRISSAITGFMTPLRG